MTSPRFRFELIVTLGNVLTVMAIVGSCIAFVMKTNERIAVMETIVREHERRLALVENFQRPAYPR